MKKRIQGPAAFSAALVIVTLAGCGGGQSGRPEIVPQERPSTSIQMGPLARVTGVPVGVWKSGTYEIKACTDHANNAAIRRWLRLKEDGTVQWIGESGEVRAEIVPSLTVPQMRSLRVGYFEGFELSEWQTFPRRLIDYRRGDRLRVLTINEQGETLEETCRDSSSFDGQLEDSPAILSRLGSAVALAGPSGIIVRDYMGPEGGHDVLKLAQVEIQTDGRVTTQEAPDGIKLDWGLAWVQNDSVPQLMSYGEFWITDAGDEGRGSIKDPIISIALKSKAFGEGEQRLFFTRPDAGASPLIPGLQERPIPG